MKPIIKIENLSKQYRLGVVSSRTLSGDFERWFAKLRGKEDPFLKIGEENKLDNREGEYVWALKDINLEVKRGEILGIIGKNGAGKSTLLKILSRVTGPTTGNVKINGRIASLLEVGTGFQPELTGEENIYLNGAILGMTKKEIKDKLDEIVSFAGVEKYINTPVKRYSSGMYVRLAFAVAAHLDPEILLVDEVLAVGDAEFQKKAIGKMKDVSNNSGRTILFVSHNMGSLKSLCNKGVCLKDGIITSIGTITDTIKLYLSENSNSKLLPEKHFDIKTNKPFQLLEIKICDFNSNVKYEFECDEDLNLIMKFKINEKIPGVFAYLQISKSDFGTPVLISDSNDLVMNFFDSLPLGESYVKVVIPKRTLGVGEYTVYLNFASSYNISSFNVDSPFNVISFYLSDNTSKRGNSREGYLSTLLNWELV